ncbi:sterile alpha motif domain-containing protein 12-like [Latimeria chalumnae]|uniref:sterile alpha motif domain-containing protein 12-like n=1 Tax=Latimeria chalumnae TaxID=7897 RepID=UPI00313F1855
MTNPLWRTRTHLGKPVPEWSVQDVCDWVKSQSPQHHSAVAAAVISHKVSGPVLLRLTDRKLQRMGLSWEAQRQELLQEVLLLRVQAELDKFYELIKEDFTESET